jgi:hypothetical protein
MQKRNATVAVIGAGNYIGGAAPQRLNLLEIRPFGEKW